jgi:hypothetical protein
VNYLKKIIPALLGLAVILAVVYLFFFNPVSPKSISFDDGLSQIDAVLAENGTSREVFNGAGIVYFDNDTNALLSELTPAKMNSIKVGLSSLKNSVSKYPDSDDKQHLLDLLNIYISTIDFSLERNSIAKNYSGMVSAIGNDLDSCVQSAAMAKLMDDWHKNYLDVLDLSGLDERYGSKYGEKVLNIDLNYEGDIYTVFNIGNAVLALSCQNSTEGNA